MGIGYVLGNRKMGMVDRLNRGHDRVRMTGELQNQNIIESVSDVSLKKDCVKLNSSVTRLMRVVSGMDTDNITRGESIVLERELDLAMGYLKELKSYINN